MTSKQKYLLGAFILIIFIIVSFVSIGMRYDHKMVHGYPKDCLLFCYFHLPYITYIQENGIQNQSPPQTVSGLENTFPIHPGLFYLIIGYTNRIIPHIPIEELYSLFVIFTLFVFIPLLAFNLIRNSDYTIALLSIPFLLYAVRAEHAITLLTGKSIMIIGICLLLVALTFLTHQISIMNTIFLGIILCALLLTHIGVLIYFIALSAIFIVYKWIRFERKNTLINRQAVIALVIVGIIVFLISFDFLILFFKAWIPHEKSAVLWGSGNTLVQKSTIRTTGGTLEHIFDYSFDIWVYPVFLIGLLVSVWKEWKAEKVNDVRIIMFTFLILSLLSISISRFLDLHRFWYIPIGYFSAVGIYTFYNFLSKKYNFARSASTIPIIVIILSALILIGHPTLASDDGALQNTWSIFDRINSEIRYDDKILVIVPNEDDFNQYWQIKEVVDIWDIPSLQHDIEVLGKFAFPDLIYKKGFSVKRDCQDMIVRRSSFFQFEDLTAKDHDICGLRRHTICDYSLILFTKESLSGRVHLLEGHEITNKFVQAVEMELIELHERKELTVLHNDENAVIARLNIPKERCHAAQS